jgi:DNA-binding MarR family transcriptional regulator
MSGISDTFDPFSPAACVCFNLRRTVRAVTRRYDATLAPVGLTANQFSLLAMLSGLGPIAPGVLADRLGTDRTTLTRNLGPLSRDGLIDIRPEEDRRRRTIHLTPAGRDRLAMALPLWRRAQSEIVEHLGERSLEGLFRELRRLESPSDIA